MADNILRGIISIEAPGVDQAAAKTSQAVGKVEQSLRRVSPASNNATLSLINLGRVVQDAPFGFLGIANNLNPLVESFQRTGQAAGGFSGAMRSLGSSLLGAGGVGLAISAISTGLILFGDKLFSGAAASDKLDDSLRSLTKTADDAKEAIKAFNVQADFLKQIGSINVDFNFSDDFERSSLKLAAESVALDEAILKIEQGIEKVSKANNEASDKFFSTASRSAIATIDKFGGFADVPDDVAEKFSKAERKIFEAGKKLQTDLVKLQEDLDKKINERSIARAQIRLNNITKERADLEEALKKQKEAYEEYVRNTIAQGKLLANFFKDRRPVPIELVQDSLAGQKFTKEQQLQKALQFIKQVRDGVSDLGTSNLRLPVTIEPIFKIEKPDVIEQFRKAVKDIQDTVNTPGMQDLKIPLPGFITTAQNKGEQDRLRYVDQLKAKLDSARQAASFFAEAISGAFEALLSGKSVIQAIGQALKALVVDLIRATLQTLIFKAIANFLAPGAGGGTFKPPSFSLGGGVSAISPGMGGRSSLGNQVVFRLQGRELVGVLSNEIAAQGRGF